MTSYVEIVLRRNRGWPWPEDSYGLTPMYGEDGWCHSCGVPKHEQTGPIVLQRKGLASATGGWVPNWQFDVYCLEAGLASTAATEFGLNLREVAWPREPFAEASQIVIPKSDHPWFDPLLLADQISSVHGQSSESCAACGVTRWYPVGMDVLLAPPPALLAGDPPVLASQEWFGVGKRSFHQIIWRRDVAEFLVKSSPKDFKIHELHW